MQKDPTVLGIDLGGTKIAIARYRGKDLVLEESQIFPLDTENGFESVKEQLIDVVERYRKDDTNAIGIGVPGLVDKHSEKILKLPNIPGAEHQDLVGWLEHETGLPVTIANDAELFTLAEALYGAGKGESVVVGITMGTGVGGGIVIDRKIFRGANGFAGEIGHMLLQPGSPPFPTEDKRGEVEQFLSGTAMGKRCEAAKNPEEYLDGEVCDFMQPDVFREVAWLITNLTHVLDPSVIVFGGSAGRALKPHLKKVETELKAWMLPGTPLPKIIVSEMADAAMRGAAECAMKLAR